MSFTTYYGCQIKDNEMGVTCRTNGENEKSIHMFSRKVEGKRPLVRPTDRWEDETKKSF
jgi:hypothetical protein